MTKEDLYAEAKRLNIKGRSKMTKAELEMAVRDANPKASRGTSAQTQDSDATPVVVPVGKPQPVHMPNSERVQKYVRQRDGLMFKSSVDIRTKLTSRQMRRVRKNANKHGEGFIINKQPPLSGWHSLLARTPEGLGIFYQFSKASA